MYTYVLVFSHFVGALNAHRIALRKRLPGPPSDWPLPDCIYCWLEGSRFTSVGLHLFLASIAPINDSKAARTRRASFSGDHFFLAESPAALCKGVQQLLACGTL